MILTALAPTAAAAAVHNNSVFTSLIANNWERGHITKQESDTASKKSVWTIIRVFRAALIHLFCHQECFLSFNPSRRRHEIYSEAG